MNSSIKKILFHPLISGSSIVFVGSFLVNFINYLFNLAMGRLLTVSEYSLLISLASLITLLTIFQTSLTMLFAKFAARYSAIKDTKSEGSLINLGMRLTFGIGIIFFIILLILMRPLSSYLHISNDFLMLIVNLSVFFSILYSLPNGILQGNLKFLLISLANVIGGMGKLAVGIGLVVLGWGVFGGSVGISVLFIVPYLISMTYVLKKYNIMSHREIHVNFIGEFKKVSGPFLLASIAITLFQGTDIIFARHYLSPTLSGQFAALSIMVKAIFYITSPIYFVFFPIISHKKEKKEKTLGTVLFALAIIMVCSSLFSLIYFLFPSIILKIFYPSPSYQILTSYLGIYSLYILIFSPAFLLYNFFLSSGVNIYKPIWLVTFIYFTLILLFHSNIVEFVLIQLISSFLLLVFLLVYYFRHETH